MESKNTIHIITQEDAEHRQFVEELQQEYSDSNFQVRFVINPYAGKLRDTNPLLADIGESIVILKVDSLPYPLPEHTHLLAALESNSKDEGIFALLTEKDFAEKSCLFAAKDLSHSFGKVYLVGAGQSNTDLLSLKAFKLIKDADIIFYDSLIDDSILDVSDAEKVFVGKRANIHFKQQADINELMYSAALKHKTVVRLKGGDPMIFGHAGEEIAYLEARLIQVETLPGVSSPLGAASMANIPLTLRNISNSVSFCSAHEKTKILVPETDTIVYFMGATNLPNIANALKSHNKPVSTPVTLFYNIGGKDQETYHETIESILTEEKAYKSPLLAIVGEVGNKKNWYKAFNYKLKVLFTGSHINKYAHLGYVFHQPMIEIHPLEDFKEFDYEIENMDSYEWIIFTSMYAADNFFNRLLGLGYDARFLSDIKIASIGKYTSKHLKTFGIIPDLQATEESSEGIIKLFKEKNITSSNILIPRSNLAHDYLPDKLMELGNVVIKLIVYNTNMPANIKKVEVENFDRVIFTSPSGIDNFMKTYKVLPIKPKIITKGKETRKRVEYYEMKQSSKQ